MSEPAALGLSVFAGRAVAVILRGTRIEPAIVLRQWLELGDPWVPESFHPYHRELGDTGPEGRAARERGCAAASRSVERAIASLLAEMRSHHFPPCGATLVVESLADPARMRGAHPGAHQAERELYREAVAAALAKGAVPATVVLAKKLRALASERLARPPRDLQAALRVFSHGVGTPWRAPEKNASLAAWLALP